MIHRSPPSWPCCRCETDDSGRAGCRQAGYRALTIEEIMAEPIVLALIQADHADPVAVEAQLRSVAARGRGREGRAPVR